MLTAYTLKLLCGEFQVYLAFGASIRTIYALFEENIPINISSCIIVITNAIILKSVISNWAGSSRLNLVTILGSELLCSNHTF